MIDTEKRLAKQREKDRVRQRMHAHVDPENYEYIPAKKQADYYDNDIHQNVGIYVRVSTTDVRQTTSYELQKKYYEDFVVRHPNWSLVKIYADEGISGTSLKHRDEFNRMIADAKSGKLDMIITKSVSRFARNVMICIGMVRELAELKPPVGVFFESECIFSLNDESQMALSFQATMAEEESHIRSRSMETSLRMRLDNGIPLTPKLLGYTHDVDGNLVVNAEEAKTVKLAFYMYLYGYSTQQIADCFNAMERKSYLGNVNWTSNGIIQILRNERHCGDVLTRKTFTPDFHSHLSRKNHGERPQSHYFNHHEPIISRDDFIAVQQMLDNSKYRNKSILPELRVIDEGLLKGFVIINTRWAGFDEIDYMNAAQSVAQKQPDNPVEDVPPSSAQVEVSAGDFDLRGFEVARPEFFNSVHRPFVTIGDKKIKFSAFCVRKPHPHGYVELLINPITRQLAVRESKKENRNAVCWAKISNGVYYPKEISIAAFERTLFQTLGWKPECKYRILGTLVEQDSNSVLIFNAADSEALIKSYLISANRIDGEKEIDLQPLTATGNRVRAIPEAWVGSFGAPYYQHEQSIDALEKQSESDWALQLEGRLFVTGQKLHVTDFKEIREYISHELNNSLPQGGNTP